MPSPIAINSTDSDSSCEAPPSPTQKAARKKRPKAKPLKMAQPPKRPKSLLQHRADLEKKEQRRRKLKPKKQKQTINLSEEWSSDSSDSESQLVPKRRQQPPQQEQAENDAQDSGPGFASFTTALKKQTSENNVTKYKKRSRTTGSMDEDDSPSYSDSEESSQSFFREERKPKRRKHKPPQKAHSSKDKTPQQSSIISRKSLQTTSTEVLFPAHILAEEVQSYIQSRNKDGPEPLTEAEIKHLNEWVAKAQDELEQQNQHVLENIGLVVDLRKVNRRRNQLQDQLLQQKKKTQAWQQEATVYQIELLEAKKEHSTAESAQQFLRALKGLAPPK